MAKNAAPAGAPLWMVTFADLMSLLVCFFVLIISFSVPDTKKMKIVAGSMRDAFGFQREMIVTGMVEIDGDPRHEYASDLMPLPVKEKVGPIPEDGEDIAAISARQDAWEQIIESLESSRPPPGAIDAPYDPARDTAADTSAADEAALNEEQRFDRIEAELRQAMQAVPDLERLAAHLQIEQAPEGLRIQIVDQARHSMFPLGSDRMYRSTTALLGQVALAIAHLPNKISIVGHTDGVAFRGDRDYDNWSLSLDRADATRRTLVAAGLDPSRIATIIGKADTEHLFPDAPNDPRNRRISITLLRETPAAADHGDG